MKKTIIVTLELDSEEDIPIEEIKRDIETEINCATYYYDVKSVEEQQ